MSSTTVKTEPAAEEPFFPLEEEEETKEDVLVKQELGDDTWRTRRQNQRRERTLDQQQEDVKEEEEEEDEEEEEEEGGGGGYTPAVLDVYAIEVSYLSPAAGEVYKIPILLKPPHGSTNMYSGDTHEIYRTRLAQLVLLLQDASLEDGMEDQVVPLDSAAVLQAEAASPRITTLTRDEFVEKYVTRREEIFRQRFEGRNGPKGEWRIVREQAPALDTVLMRALDHILFLWTHGVLSRSEELGEMDPLFMYVSDSLAPDQTVELWDSAHAEDREAHRDARQRWGRAKLAARTYALLEPGSRNTVHHADKSDPRGFDKWPNKHAARVREIDYVTHELASTEASGSMLYEWPMFAIGLAFLAGEVHAGQNALVHFKDNSVFLDKQRAYYTRLLERVDDLRTQVRELLRLVRASLTVAKQTFMKHGLQSDAPETTAIRSNIDAAWKCTREALSCTSWFIFRWNHTLGDEMRAINNALVEQWEGAENATWLQRVDGTDRPFQAIDSPIPTAWCTATDIYVPGQPETAVNHGSTRAAIRERVRAAQKTWQARLDVTGSDAGDGLPVHQLLGTQTLYDTITRGVFLGHKDDRYKESRVCRLANDVLSPLSKTFRAKKKAIPGGLSNVHGETALRVPLVQTIILWEDAVHIVAYFLEQPQAANFATKSLARSLRAWTDGQLQRL